MFVNSQPIVNSSGDFAHIVKDLLSYHRRTYVNGAEYNDLCARIRQHSLLFESKFFTTTNKIELLPDELKQHLKSFAGSLFAWIKENPNQIRRWDELPVEYKLISMLPAAGNHPGINRKKLQLDLQVEGDKSCEFLGERILLARKKLSSSWPIAFGALAHELWHHHIVYGPVEGLNRDNPNPQTLAEALLLLDYTVLTNSLYGNQQIYICAKEDFIKYFAQISELLAEAVRAAFHELVTQQTVSGELAELRLVRSSNSPELQTTRPIISRF